MCFIQICLFISSLSWNKGKSTKSSQFFLVPEEARNTQIYLDKTHIFSAQCNTHKYIIYTYMCVFVCMCAHLHNQILFLNSVSKENEMHMPWSESVHVRISEAYWMWQSVPNTTLARTHAQPSFDKEWKRWIARQQKDWETWR